MDPNERRKAAAKSLKAFFGDGPAQDLSPAMSEALGKLEALAQPRLTNLDKQPLAGAWLYTDFPGAEPVEVEVRFEDGACIVSFAPRDGDQGAEVLFDDMGAKDSWQEHFQRLR